ncbi:MAG TPA: hypothetical protein VGB85_26625 [Nannocystis sp.]|jgi:hypothetical protein
MDQRLGREAGQAIDDCAAQAGAMTEELVKIDVEIAADGRVTAARAYGTTLGKNYHECAARAVRSVRFDAVGDAQKYTYQHAVR